MCKVDFINAHNFAGYTSTLSRDEAGQLSVSNRHIRELSVVQAGARPDCRLWSRSLARVDA